jgi:hypothetical protein
MQFVNLDDEYRRPGDDTGNAIEQYIHLPKMPRLRGLNLYNTAFRGDGLENIPAIELLCLTATDIDDHAIPALSALTKLKELSIEGTNVSDAGFEELRRALPNCTIYR